MATPTLDELRDVWTHRSDDASADDAAAWNRAVLDLLADGRPVGADRIAAATGLAQEDVADLLAAARTAGCEVDDQGRLIGVALTLNPTPHHFRVRGNDLYAWCGFDTLFLPILLGEDAEVISTCPQTGRQIQLSVAADGTVSAVQPATTVVAVVGREVTSCCGTTGPQSSVCTQMPFLADFEAASAWLDGRSGVAAVTLDEATHLARAYAG